MTQRRGTHDKEVFALAARQADAPQRDALRERLLQAGDAERRAIERDLHDGVQQHLIALAVNLQLARTSAEDDPAATVALLEQMSRDVQQALDDTMRLAQRVYPSLLERGGLAAALRTAAVTAGVRASIEVPTGASYPADIARTICFCWDEALAAAAAGGRAATIAISADEDVLVFEVGMDATHLDGVFEGIGVRCEALGGRMTVRSEPARGTRVTGSLPLSR
jgi:signal transduction histidine kinase